MEKLQEILSTMDVPKLRVNDIHWLQRNLEINNSNHPDINEAMEIIKQIIRERK